VFLGIALGLTRPWWENHWSQLPYVMFPVLATLCGGVLAGAAAYAGLARENKDEPPKEGWTPLQWLANARRWGRGWGRQRRHHAPGYHRCHRCHHRPHRHRAQATARGGA
jgi:hypothetical protein